ncbi:MAG: helix-turn-helix domain-containing protein [Oscillospiraceae bacterium]|nr:helix-turn-helix domain-containing protein [Oscillospiraceae bacterium]
MDEKKKTDHLPVFISVYEFAEYLGIGLSLAYQYTRAKDFPVIQLRKKGRIIIDIEAALEWLRETTLYSRPQYYDYKEKWWEK